MFFVTEKPSKSMPRLDIIQSGAISLQAETCDEYVEQRVKKFNVDDLTHQVLDNRNSAIGSNQESLEKIGRWGK